MIYTKDFSVIVPVWRGAIKFLPKLFDSIPKKDGIEIIVVDNSKEPVRREEIKSDREIVFLHSDYERHAGGSRNEGMAVAQGKWLLFADADDFYTPDAFDIYYSNVDTDAEIVYTGMGGIYEDTGEPSDRGERYAKLVHDYCEGVVDEMVLRTGFPSPCCKMVSHELVDREGLRYDEIRASNDIYFSLTTGLNAKKIFAVDKVTYIATVNHGSLTQHRDFEVIRARLFARLRYNQLLRVKGLNYRQASIMSFIVEARHYRIKQQFVLWEMVVKYRQNPFIGWRRWGKTWDKVKKQDIRDSKYRVR